MIRAATPEERALLAAQIGVFASPAARGIVSATPRGLAAGVLYDQWTASAVFCHILVASPGAARGLLPAAFEYPFVTADRSVLLAFVRERNSPSVSLVTRLGFREAHRTPGGAAPGEDLLLFEMHRHACRWLKERNDAPHPPSELGVTGGSAPAGQIRREVQRPSAA